MLTLIFVTEAYSFTHCLGKPAEPIRTSTISFMRRRGPSGDRAEPSLFLLPNCLLDFQLEIGTFDSKLPNTNICMQEAPLNLSYRQTSHASFDQTRSCSLCMTRSFLEHGLLALHDRRGLAGQRLERVAMLNTAPQRPTSWAHATKRLLRHARWW